MPLTTHPKINKLNRYYANLAPIYYWALVVEAWLKGRSLSEEAGSLLSAKLMQRKGEREEMLATVAGQIGMSRDELWQAIIDGTIAPNLEPIDPGNDEKKV